MSDVLSAICERKREHVASCKRERPLASLHALLSGGAAPRGFAAALRRATAEGGPGLIAEIKRASPSRGVIRTEFDVAALASAYAAGGAACLSVLTDAPYFGGTLDDLACARAATALSALRKDFLLDPYQVAEARAGGADAILLIIAALDQAQAVELEDAAGEYGLDVLIEVHDEAELERALSLRSPLIGINNRDLKTLAVDISTTERLAPLIPSDRLVVCESGIGAPSDILRMRAVGVYCFLVGESLLRQPDVRAATAALLGPVPQ